MFIELLCFQIVEIIARGDGQITKIKSFPNSFGEKVELFAENGLNVEKMSSTETEKFLVTIHIDCVNYV